MNTPEQIHAAFEPWRKKYARIAYLPKTSPSDAADSWFGGVPTDSSSSEWPQCSGCNQPMRFMLQLNLADLPETFTTPLRSGRLQLFYCSTDDGMCETWAHFSGTHDLRIVDEPVALDAPAAVEPLPKTLIVGWEAFEDCPHAEEHEDYGLRYQYDFASNQFSVSCEEFQFEFHHLELSTDVIENSAAARAGDKLGGYPYWVQSVEYPPCPVCDARMELLFQLDSEDNLPYMFGDAGCSHITQCPHHPRELAFGWACG